MNQYKLSVSTGVCQGYKTDHCYPQSRQHQFQYSFQQVNYSTMYLNNPQSTKIQEISKVSFYSVFVNFFSFCTKQSLNLPPMSAQLSIKQATARLFHKLSGKQQAVRAPAPQDSISQSQGLLYQAYQLPWQHRQQPARLKL